MLLSPIMKEFTNLPTVTHCKVSYLLYLNISKTLHDLRGIAEYNIEDILVYFRTLLVLMITAPTVVKYPVVSRKALNQ